LQVTDARRVNSCLPLYHYHCYDYCNTADNFSQLPILTNALE